MELSVRDVARLLDLSEETITRWVREGRLSAQHWDDQYRFNKVELQECARALGRPLAPDLFRSDASRPLPRLSDALARGGIFHALPGGHRDEVLAAISQLPAIPAGVDRTLLRQLLIAREKLAPTGIGAGIAIPHPRDPLVVRVDEPVAVLGFPAQPVDFRAADSKPVNVIFTLLCPTVRMHLQLLSALSFALHDGELSELLRTQAPSEALLARLRTIESRASGLAAPNSLPAALPAKEP